jgi:hypothetical protein
MKLLRLDSCLLLALGALLLQAGAAAQTYSAKPIRATVVDADSGEPLAGVNVVAQWILHDNGWKRVGDLELLEAVTGADGSFRFPGWQGKTPPMAGLYGTRLGNDDPALVLFKSGYKVRGVGNDLQPERLLDANHTWQRYSDWDGKIIKLEKFNGNMEVYTALAAGTLTGLGEGLECPWKRVPRLISALIKERDRLNKLGVRNYLPSIEHMELYFKNAHCGSAKEFLEEYLK